MRNRLLISILLALAVMTASAQRISCIRPSDQAGTRANGNLLPEPLEFDPQKIYRQPVILISFADADFSMADPVTFYNRLFNEHGYTEGKGLGCVADYVRDQSGGRLNLQFDIYGPVKVKSDAGGHGSRYFGDDIQREAIRKLSETETTDFSIYDWDGNNEVNQVLFVVASYCGNQESGYLWPNTGRFNSPLLPGGIYAARSSISCELWKYGTSCGIGTIVHELFHCLGLPDIYPLDSATAFSAVDEWDLMDGGNYTNYGWCPPNLSTMEKMVLGWGEPVELTASTSVTSMKPLSDGGEAYIIRNPANPEEFYLLENRQQKGWDYGCPGNGLLIFHVDYDDAAWRDAKVNVSDSHYRYDLFHADGKDYLDWDPDNDGEDDSKWVDEFHLHNRYLSTSVYPYIDPVTLVINASLTNDSDPAATLFKANSDGQRLMSKPVTNIQMASDGTISFDFMKEPTGIHDIWMEWGKAIDGQWYDLQGRRLQSEPSEHGVYIYNKKKIIR